MQLHLSSSSFAKARSGILLAYVLFAVVGWLYLAHDDEDRLERLYQEFRKELEDESLAIDSESEDLNGDTEQLDEERQENLIPDEATYNWVDENEYDTGNSEEIADDLGPEEEE